MTFFTVLFLAFMLCSSLSSDWSEKCVALITLLIHDRLTVWPIYLQLVINMGVIVIIFIKVVCVCVRY